MFKVFFPQKKFHECNLKVHHGELGFLSGSIKYESTYPSIRLTIHPNHFQKWSRRRVIEKSVFVFAADAEWHTLTVVFTAAWYCTCFSATVMGESLGFVRIISEIQYTNRMLSWWCSIVSRVTSCLTSSVPMLGSISTMTQDKIMNKQMDEWTW